MNLECACLECFEHGNIYEGTITERDMAISRDKFLARTAPKGFPLYYRIKQFISPTRLSARYSLFMFELEDKSQKIYSNLISLGFPSPIK
jgi:hypothetical protein